jgi:hypothetical protein
MHLEYHVASGRHRLRRRLQIDQSGGRRRRRGLLAGSCSTVGAEREEDGDDSHHGPENQQRCEKLPPNAGSPQRGRGTRRHRLIPCRRAQPIELAESEARTRTAPLQKSQRLPSPRCNVGPFGASRSKALAAPRPVIGGVGPSLAQSPERNHSGVYEPRRRRSGSSMGIGRCKPVRTTSKPCKKSTLLTIGPR